MRSKREVFHFLSHECGLYLPSFDTVTIFHLKDLFNNVRRRIKGKDVIHLSVPFYEDLKIEEFIKFANENPSALDYLPAVQKEIWRLPR